jgi:hypothetical protein
MAGLDAWQQIMAMYGDIRTYRPPTPVNVTRAEFEHIRRLVPTTTDEPDWSRPVTAGLFGIPLVVDDDRAEPRPLADRLRDAFLPPT